MAKILHTSDWHAGRIWKSISRLDELGDVLEHLGEFTERERVDLLLMSGDVFDSGAPHPEAEKLVFGFFKRVGLSGTKSVVIAGNHDSPARLEAWGGLTELVDVFTVPVPRRPEKGGVIELGLRSGELVRVAAVPFAPVHRLVSALELAEDETRSRQKYDAMMREIFRQLSQSFTRDRVNLLMAHTHLQGAVFSGSERQVHLGAQWATTPQALPSRAHYIALGHIHKPQAVSAAPAPAYYAGSPLQLDFGEEGELKSFVLIDARAGEPVHIDRIPYEGGKELTTVTGRLDLIERRAEVLSRKDWLRVRLRLTRPEPDVSARVRRLLPNALVVEAELPNRDPEKEKEAPPRGETPAELFRGYFAREHGREAGDDLVAAFQDLHREADSGSESE